MHDDPSPATLHLGIARRLIIESWNANLELLANKENFHSLDAHRPHIGLPANWHKKPGDWRPSLEHLEAIRAALREAPHYIDIKRFTEEVLAQELEAHQLALTWAIVRKTQSVLVLVHR